MLSIIQSAFFGPEALGEIISPATDNSFQLHSLLIDRLGITLETLRKFHSGKATAHLIKPWERQILLVTLDGKNATLMAQKQMRE